MLRYTYIACFVELILFFKWHIQTTSLLHSTR